MVAVCDLKYDISDYVEESQNERQHQYSVQLSKINKSFQGNFCKSGSPSSYVDWKCEAFELIGAAVKDSTLNWRQLYNAMQNVISVSVVIKESPTLEKKFNELAKQWRAETKLFSSVEMIAMRPAYQQIIGMGTEALPYILSELSREPDHWFWALSAITGENPVSPDDAGNLTRMTEAWLKLGRKRGWI